MGLRAKATTIDVPSCIGMAAVAARANGRNGSWLSSADHKPSYPAARASAATDSAWASSPDKYASIFSACPF